MPFMYKYVVVDFNTKQAKRWESGPNRICDPEYVPSMTLVDEWEHFTVTFSIYLPTNDPTV